MKSKMKSFIYFLPVLLCCGCGFTNSDQKQGELSENYSQEELKYGYRVDYLEQSDGMDVVCGQNPIFFGKNEYDWDGNVQNYCCIYQEDAGKLIQRGEIPAKVEFLAGDAESLYALCFQYEADGNVEQRVIQWDFNENQVHQEIMLETEDGTTPYEFEKIGDYFIEWDNNSVKAFDRKGENVWNFEQNQSVLSVCCGEKEIYVCLRKWDGANSSTEFLCLNLADGTIKRRWQSSEEYDIERMVCRDNQILWVINSRKGISLYDMEADSYEQIVSWMEEGISDIYIQDVYSNESDGLNVFVRDRETNKNILITVSYGLLDRENDKQSISMAMPWMSDGMKEAIVQFNKTNPKYRIEVVGSGENELYGEYRESLGTKFATGNAPDIFLLPPEDYAVYREKGILEDIAYIFESENGLKKDDYYEKVFERYEEGSSLYGLPLCFTLETVVARDSNDLSKGGWTFEEMKNRLQNEQITELICAGSKKDVLKYCLLGTVAEDEMVDLDEESLSNMLCFADTYGADDDNLQRYEGQMYHLLEEDKSILMNASIQNIGGIPLYQALMNDNIEVVGYPSGERIPAYIRSDFVLAVSSGTDCKEAFGDFVRILLSDKMQRKMDGFSVSKPVMENVLEEALEENSDNVTTGIFVDDEYIPLERPVKEDILFVQNLIEQSVSYPYGTEAAMDIVMEEATSYFKGQKSEQEVSDIILNRIRLMNMEEAK